jgi:hypothetical protein
MQKSIVFAVSAIWVCCSTPAIALDSLIEPGILESVETKDGTTTEKYSDGLIVETKPNGDRSETREADGWSMTASSGTDPNFPPTDLEGFEIFAELPGAGSPNSSQMQSRLREQMVMLLQMKHPEMAEQPAEYYVHIQKILNAPTSLAFGQLKLGEIKLALGKFSDAEKQFKLAGSFYKGDKDEAACCESLQGLAAALDAQGLTSEAVDVLHECKGLASAHSLLAAEKQAEDLLEKINSRPASRK